MSPRPFRPALILLALLLVAAPVWPQGAAPTARGPATAPRGGDPEAGAGPGEPVRLGGEVVIRISDTGKGIPPDAMPFIFEPFFTTKKVGQGTGLGLAIVHGVVTRAGGKVEVASVPGATTFTIKLPVGREDAAV